MKQKPAIRTVDRLREIKPCDPSIDWLAENNITELADAWDQCHRADWLLWLDSVLDLLSARERHLIACRCVREMPLIDGRTVWDLLTDERSRQAVVVAERYVAGEATDEELAAARVAAVDAARAADVAYAPAARATASAAAAAADAAAAYAARAAAMAAEAATYVVKAHVVAAADATQADTADVAAAASVAAEAVSYAALADTAYLIREIVGNPFRAS